VNLVYGVFDELGPAEAACQELREQATAREEPEAAAATIHQRQLSPDALAPTGTVWRAALTGAALTAGVVGVALVFLSGGALATTGAIHAFIGRNVIDVVALTVTAALVGGILAAIAGQSIRTARIRRLERAVANGGIVLTLSAPARHVQPILATMTHAGAMRTGAF
jgi:hypothetical protein